MAAISAVLMSQLRTGDAVVLPDDGYQALPWCANSSGRSGSRCAPPPPATTPSSR
ncbi:hypothetical protein ACFQ60_25465 [Streptomyces zhihengii]